MNFCPTYPTGEISESLEDKGKSLLSDVKKRNNRETIKQKMVKTFTYRRHEVVCDAPMSEDLMSRWPALFNVSEARY